MRRGLPYEVCGTLRASNPGSAHEHVFETPQTASTGPTTSRFEQAVNLVCEDRDRDGPVSGGARAPRVGISSNVFGVRFEKAVNPVNPGEDLLPRSLHHLCILHSRCIHDTGVPRSLENDTPLEPP